MIHDDHPPQHLIFRWSYLQTNGGKQQTQNYQAENARLRATQSYSELLRATVHHITEWLSWWAPSFHPIQKIDGPFPHRCPARGCPPRLCFRGVPSGSACHVSSVYQLFIIDLIFLRDQTHIYLDYTWMRDWGFRVSSILKQKCNLLGNAEWFQRNEGPRNNENQKMAEAYPPAVPHMANWWVVGCHVSTCLSKH